MLSSLVSGNLRLGLSLFTSLFNSPSSSLFDYQEANNYGAVKDFDAEGKCEARVFSLWLNSIGVKPAIFNLFENLRGGSTHYFQALDKILPGFAVWRCVSQKRSTNHAPDDV
ncbi:hypothetical protein DEU56DRAFT_755230 [Suillus clintonianus]|uniref:uncharacterized protein n=1 Tax=Suillus clintonianus TaxID=1904413 RepID=UPI001B87E238|nr:uncharacterized protein DEU56DRAFT_755230 [Suillus clintonianus]KAG2140618.1 hypothetical protein DEU56DRAFT_755230 [Suillus clintonianus]